MENKEPNPDNGEGVEINHSSILKDTDEHSGKTQAKKVPEFSEDDKNKGVSFHPAVEVTEIPSVNNIMGGMPEDSEITEEPLKDPPPLMPEPPQIDEDTPTMEQLYKTEGAVKSYQERKLSTEPKIVRRMNRVDIETGRIAWKHMTARPIWDFKDPMNPVDRRKGIVSGLAQNQTEFDEQNSERKQEELEAVQYRLHSKVEDRNYFHKEFKLIPTYLHWTFRATFASIIITDFIAFFVISGAWACAIYLGSLVSPRCFVVAGTPLIEMEDWKQHFYFMDAFQLSWTTFSTVGYGIVYPNVNKGSIDARPDCFVFSFLITLESFVGILFAAFCGSIIFGKIARIQSVAPIRWSDPLVIRYGKGVVEPKPSVSKRSLTDEDDSDSDSDDEGNGDNKTSSSMMDGSEKSIEAMSMSGSSKSKSNKIVKYPPPVLEFRVINTLNEHHGGEIMNAELGVYASTEASKSMESLAMTESQAGASTAVANLLSMSLGLTQKTGRALQKTKNGLSKASHVTSSVLQKSTAKTTKTTGSIVQKVNRAITRPSMMMPMSVNSSTISEEQPELQPYNKEQEINREMVMATLALATSTANHITVDEGNGSLVPRHIFSKMEIETDTHPFFKRVWNVRHTLDERSPLLSAKVKRIMQKNKGKWPEEICNAEFIRKNIHFHQIIVQLSGTHNSSGSDVFGMHVYEFDSVNIGYRFAQMLDVNEDGKLYVDTELLNDVREQRGGGGEDIIGIIVDEFGGLLPSAEDQTPAATARGETEDLINPKAEITA